MSRSIWQRELPPERSVADADATPDAATTRRPTAGDIDALAELMLDAYVETIDYDGETIDEARAEVGSWFENADARLDWSIVAIDGAAASGAVLAGEFEATAFVHYVMVRSTAKSRGLATLLLTSVLDDGPVPESAWAADREIRLAHPRGRAPGCCAPIVGTG